MKPQDEQEKLPSKMTDISAAKNNVEAAVVAFIERWICLPAPIWPCEVMNQSQLRDAMGLYATIDVGDPWPQAEKFLLEMGFRWHSLGSERVMYLREREDAVVDDGWNDGEEIES